VIIIAGQKVSMMSILYVTIVMIMMSVKLVFTGTWVTGVTMMQMIGVASVGMMAIKMNP